MVNAGAIVVTSLIKVKSNGSSAMNIECAHETH